MSGQQVNRTGFVTLSAAGADRVSPNRMALGLRRSQHSCPQYSPARLPGWLRRREPGGPGPWASKRIGNTS